MPYAETVTLCSGPTSYISWPKFASSANLKSAAWFRIVFFKVHYYYTASRSDWHRTRKYCLALFKCGFQSPILTMPACDLHATCLPPDSCLTEIYEVCKLSNETGNVAPDLATLRRRDLIGRFCFRLGHSATNTFAKLQHAYRDSVFSRAQVFRWFKAFSEGTRVD
ncbi:hypothetical protein NQ318_004739 [Aromia moschata]|uniref:Mos1 transposase HTH domain-containing protein n=1 Tax=Aromia moschata TaxID=1265417 RepID=A0AAV8XBB3_9CUCU|nr:hypothetical protein NQ318_004739 [Aromia moschata]